MWAGVAPYIVGGILALLNALILFTLKRLVARLDKQDSSIAANKSSIELFSKALSDCKVDCLRSFVTDEAFLRETGFVRRTLETQTASLNRMEGQLTITEKLPQIVGEISRNIVREMKVV